MEKIINALEDCIQIADHVHKKYFAKLEESDITSKASADFDLLTIADKETEDQVIKRILDEFPDHNILGEEGGERKNEGNVRWIIDPIDGTINFAHHMPFFCISIAVEIDGVVQLGAVRNAIKDEYYRAEKGKGATLNGSPIHVSKVDSINQSLIITGFPYDRRERIDHYLNQYKAFNQVSHGILRLGSAALDICAVAAGRAEAYYEENLNAWDWAGAMLIVEEAGGKVTDYHGESDIYNKRQMLATNGLIHQESVDILKPTVS